MKYLQVYRQPLWVLLWEDLSWRDMVMKHSKPFRNSILGQALHVVSYHIQVPKIVYN